MGIVYGGPGTVREREYLFIDGGCLRAALRSLSAGLGLPDDALKVMYPLLAGQADKVFYYDAISAQGYDEPIADYQARIEFEHEGFDKIRALDRFHVALGEVKGRGRNRRQKQVDVRLAVDMLTHTFRGNIQRATLFAGDDDFIPLVEALVREGLSITIWHPPQASEALLSAADNRRPFDLACVHSLLTFDGRTPAFQQLNHGSNAIGPTFPGGRARWNAGSYQYEGQWKDGSLTVFRRWQNSMWEFQIWRCGVDSPTAAVKFLERVHGWDLGSEAVQLLEESDR